MTGAAAFLKFARDKRGYEHFYLVQPTTNRRGRTRSRILYWFRTPPGVKVGRMPFADEVQRAIEAQNPGVSFDWKRLLATPIPPPAPDVERWRERRRLERLERAARRAEQGAEREPEGPEGDDTQAADAPQVDAVPGASVPASSAPAQASSAAGEAPGQAARRRRRRRGRRGPKPAQTAAATAPGSTDAPPDAVQTPDGE